MLTRREFLQFSLLYGLAACAPAGRRRSFVRFSLLHLAPKAGDIKGNWEQIEAGAALAAASGADWVLTSELCTSGYEFEDVLGVDWIRPQPDARVAQFCTTVRRLGVNFFLGTPEFDPLGKKYYNSMLVIGREGALLGRHRKVKVVPRPAEAWSTPGTEVRPLDVAGVPTGVLICADSYEPDLSGAYKNQGAGLLVSGAAWPPGESHPESAWEDRSRETGLTLLVCNRTGRETRLDFSNAESVIVSGGQRRLAYQHPKPAVLTADLEAGSYRPLSSSFSVEAL